MILKIIYAFRNKILMRILNILRGKKDLLFYNGVFLLLIYKLHLIKNELKKVFFVLKIVSVLKIV